MTRLGLVFLLVAVCASSAPVASAAQRGGGRGQGAPGGRNGGPARFVQPPAIPEQPSINRPSFPIDGPNRPSFPIHGTLGVGPATPSPFAATPRTYSRPSRRTPFYGIPFGYGFGLPAYGDTATPDKRRQSRSDEEILSGTVFLDATPRTAMVFIDSAYVGAVDDLLFTGVTLSRPSLARARSAGLREEADRDQRHAGPAAAIPGGSHTHPPGSARRDSASTA